MIFRFQGYFCCCKNKVSGIGKIPLPPHVGKNSQIILKKKSEGVPKRPLGFHEDMEDLNIAYFFVVIATFRKVIVLGKCEMLYLDNNNNRPSCPAARCGPH